MRSAGGLPGLREPEGRTVREALRSGRGGRRGASRRVRGLLVLAAAFLLPGLAEACPSCAVGIEQNELQGFIRIDVGIVRSDMKRRFLFSYSVEIEKKQLAVWVGRSV